MPRPNSHDDALFAPIAASPTWRARRNCRLIFTVLALTPALARADSYRYEDVPVGDRAAGMGGAFTGLANDGSAAYYNPAGLVLSKDSHISIGSSGWQIRTERISGYLGRL